LKKWFNHPVFVQVVCAVMAIFLVHAYVVNKAYKELVAEALRDHMATAIVTLQGNNAKLFGVYTQGAVSEDLDLSTEGIRELSRMERELEQALQIQSGPFRWWDLEEIDWNINELKNKTHLSDDEIKYIEETRRINQAFIDLYYQLMDEEGVPLKSYGKDKMRIPTVYKRFIQRANQMAMDKTYQETMAYDVEEERVHISPIDESVITVDDAQIMAENFLSDIMESLPELKLTIKEEAYEYDYVNAKFGDDYVYNVTVDRHGKSLRAYLVYHGGNGTFSEEKIDASAGEYFKKFIKEDFVLYAKELKYDEEKLDRIDYNFVYFDGHCYDLNKTMRLSVNSYGNLSRFEETYSDVLLKIPELLSVEAVRSNLKGTGHLKTVLVKTQEKDYEYWFYMKSNGAYYTIRMNPFTGEQKEVLSKAPLYYKRIEL